MKAAILNSAMLDSDIAMLNSDTLLSSLRFTQKHTPSTLTLTQTNSIWFKLIHSHSTWLWQPSWILPSWIWPSWNQPSYFFLSNTLTSCQDWFPPFAQKKPSLIDSDSTWWWWPSWILPYWILPCWIQTSAIVEFRYLVFFSQIDSKTLSLLLWLWLKLIQSDSNSFIPTQLDDGGHVEFCHLGFSFWHLGFRHLVIFSQIHSKTLSLHSDSDSN